MKNKFFIVGLCLLLGLAIVSAQYIEEEQDAEDAWLYSNGTFFAGLENPSNAVDEDFATYTIQSDSGVTGFNSAGNTSAVYENYTVPSGLASADVTVKYYTLSENACQATYTLYCYDYNVGSYHQIFTYGGDTIQTTTSSIYADCLTEDNLILYSALFTRDPTGAGSCDSDDDMKVYYYEGKVIWYKGFNETDNSYESEVYDTSRETLSLNISYNSSEYVSVTGSLIYDGVKYLANKLGSGDNLMFYKSLSIPVVTSEANKSFYWELAMTNSSTTSYYNSSSNNQTVLPSNFSQCGTTAIAVNYTIKDEDTDSLISDDFEATFTWKLNSSSSITKNISVDLSGSNNYTFCIDPNRTYFTNAEIEIRHSGYETRKYNFAFEEFTNIVKNVDLFLLNESAATHIILEVADEGLSPLEGYTVKVYRNQPSSGKMILVEQDVTNVFGQVSTQLIENTVDYDIKIYNLNNTLVKTIEDTNIICKSTICIIPIVVSDTTDDFGRFSNIDDFTCSLSFSNNTNIFTFSWNDNTGDTPTLRFLVQRIAINGTDDVCDDESTDLIGSSTCSVGSSINSYSAQAFRTVDGTEVRLLCTGAAYGTLDVKVGDLTSIFGLEGFIWSFILLFSLVLIGLWSPAVGVLLYLIGFILLGITQVIYINPAIAIAQIVIGVLLIWSLRQ